MTTKGIIFDLDGTLVDTLDDLTDSMNFGLKTLGLPTHSAAMCRQMIGHGVKTFAERAIGAKHIDKRDTLLSVMKAHYMDNCLTETNPYPGILQAINHLRTLNVRLAVLTNKNQTPTDKIVTHFFGPDTFDPVIGYAQGRQVKPDPEGVYAILEAWGMSPEEVILVGDSETDAQTAAAANIRFIGCEWGFRSRQVLLEAGATTLIRRPMEIIDRLNR